MSHRGQHASSAGTSTAEARDWRERAACIGEEPEIFFPVSHSPQAAAEALTVCRVCPVREICLAEELAHGGMQWGIRGGKTESERRAMLRQKAEPPPAYACAICGTGLPGRPHNQYQQRYCSDACRGESKQQRQAAYKERQKEAVA